MKVFYSDSFIVGLPKGHRFPMPKYALLRQQVLASNIVKPNDLKLSPPATDAQILRVHTPEYLQKIIHGNLTESEIRRLGFPWSSDLVERSRHSVGGTIAACRTALQEGLGINLAGGTHHAHPGHGEGFCVFNDVAIAARSVQDGDGIQRVVILDCDVHQGDGTAVIFRNDPSVYTFSIHGEKNFPFRKQPSDLDIGLPDGCDDHMYLDALVAGLEQALNASQPELAIYIAGADPFEGDRLGRLAITKNVITDRLKIFMARGERPRDGEEDMCLR